ncbi:MAG: exonuclease, partial [Mycobacteriaceae bacterium]
MGPSPDARRAPSARRSERRGRGVRGPLIPDSVPAWRSRAQRFDGLVLEALAPINQRWHEQLRALDIAVDEVPPVTGSDIARVRSQDAEAAVWPPEVLADAAVPLARLVRPGV